MASLDDLIAELGGDQPTSANSLPTQSRAPKASIETLDSLDNIMSSLCEPEEPKAEVRASSSVSATSSLDDLMAELTTENKESTPLSLPSVQRKAASTPLATEKRTISQETQTNPATSALATVERKTPRQSEGTLQTTVRPTATTTSTTTTLSTTSTSDPEFSKIVAPLLNSTSSSAELESALRSFVNYTAEESNRAKISGDRTGCQALRNVFNRRSNPNVNETCVSFAAQVVGNSALNEQCRTLYGDLMNDLVSTMDRSAYQEATLENVLGAIVNLVVKNETNKRKLGESAFYNKIADILTVQSTQLTLRSLTALTNSLFLDENRDKFIRTSLFNKLLSFLFEPAVQEQAAWALAALSLGKEHVNRAIVDQGGLKGLNHCLQSANASTLSKALSTVVNMSALDSLVLQISQELSQGLGSVLSQATSTHKESKLLALQCIQNLALNKGSVQYLSNSLDAVVRTLRNPEDDNIQQFALRCVINLSVDEPGRRQLVEVHHCKNAIEELLRNPRLSQESKQFAESALNNLNIST